VLFASNGHDCFRIDLADPLTGVHKLPRIKPVDFGNMPQPTMFAAKPDSSGLFIGNHEGLFEVEWTGKIVQYHPASDFGVGGFAGHGTVVGDTLIATAYEWHRDVAQPILLLWDTRKTPSSVTTHPRHSFRRFIVTSDVKWIYLPENDTTRINTDTGNRQSLRFGTPSTLDAFGDYVVLSGSPVASSYVRLYDPRTKTFTDVGRGGHALFNVDGNVVWKSASNRIAMRPASTERPRSLTGAEIVEVGSSKPLFYNDHISDVLHSPDRSVVGYMLSSDVEQTYAGRHVVVIDFFTHEVLAAKFRLLGGAILTRGAGGVAKTVSDTDSKSRVAPAKDEND